MIKKKQPFKFKPKHYGMRCNVPYVYPITIIGYNPENKLVMISFNMGVNQKFIGYIPEKDIILEPEKNI